MESVVRYVFLLLLLHQSRPHIAIDTQCLRKCPNFLFVVHLMAPIFVFREYRPWRTGQTLCLVSTLIFMLQQNRFEAVTVSKF
jgi:hypothetical protein